MSEKWDRRFLALAEHIAQWSKDPSTKTGAVIVDPDKRIVSVGYNGLPKGLRDTPERLNSREIKYKVIIHAERNAILFARESLKGYSLYVWPLMPCAPCASLIVQAGIVEVISPDFDINNPRWVDDFKLARETFSEAEVDLRLLNVSS